MLNCSMTLVQDKERVLNDNIHKVEKGMNILYSNCISHIKIDQTTLKTNKYNTLLYNEESNAAIALQRDSQISKDTLLNKIKEQNICEVSFNNVHKWNIEANYTPEILFCNDDKDLDNIIRSLIDEGKDRCYYYIDVDFLFKMGYLNTKGYPVYIIEKEGSGMIQFDNTLIFLDKNYHKNNIYPGEIIERYGIMLKTREELKFKKTRVKKI